MTHKGKQIIWHKKKEKMIPSKFSKVSSRIVEADRSASTGDKRKDFALKLKALIKRAANEDKS